MTNLDDDDENLIGLHNKWYGQFCELVDRDGVDPDRAGESMLTVAVTGLMSVHGPRYMATRLMIVSGMMSALADQLAAEGRADPKTRH